MLIFRSWLRVAAFALGVASATDTALAAPCVFGTNEVDPFKKTVKRTTEWTLVGTKYTLPEKRKWRAVETRGTRDGDKYGIGMRFFESNTTMMMGNGSELGLLLDDGSVVTLVSSAFYQTRDKSYRVYIDFDFASDADRDLVVKHGVTHFQVYSGKFVFPVPPENSTVFANATQCMLEP